MIQRAPPQVARAQSRERDRRARQELPRNDEYHSAANTWRVYAAIVEGANSVLCAALLWDRHEPALAGGSDI